MAAVARGHGGDAGGDPPPGPWRVPAQCEAAKKTRGKSTGVNLQKAFTRNGNRPLPIEFEFNDQHTFMPVGDNYSLFTRCLGNWIGAHVPMYYEGWDHVPEQDRVGLYAELEYYFDLAPHRAGPYWRLIIAGINRLAQDRYRDRKTKRKSFFKKVGGYDDVEAARNHPPTGIPREEWNKTVDHFIDPRHVQRSQVNAENRAKSQFPSLHGTSSYVSARHKKKNPETQEYPSLIDTWRDMHSRSGEWVNDAARMTHERMLAEQAAQSQQQGSSSSANDSDVLSKVLGERRGHHRGRGRKLKNVGSSSTFQESQYTAPQQQYYTQEQVNAMQENFNAFVAHSTAQMQALAEAFRMSNPHAPIPQFPAFNFPHAPPAPPPQQNVNDDEE